MHSHQRARGKVLFEALCAFSLAASFASAWDQTGSSALLASASILALFAVYWSFGLVSRRRPDHAVETLPVVAAAAEVEAEVETAPRVAIYAFEPDVATEPEPVEPDVRTEPAPIEPEVLTEAEPVAPAPKKPRARKSKKAAADVAPVMPQPEPAEFGEPVSNGLPIEQLFETQPFVRQPRAFGRKARGPRTLPAV
jgi:hypothetical protein